jgi:hypothetical protein
MSRLSVLMGVILSEAKNLLFLVRLSVWWPTFAAVG